MQSDDRIFSFCSEYSLSVSTPSSYKFCKYLSCSKFFIRNSTGFSGKIADGTRGMDTFSLDKSFAYCPFDTVLANATAAPSMTLVYESFLDFFGVTFENAGIFGGFSRSSCKLALIILAHNHN